MEPARGVLKGSTARPPLLPPWTAPQVGVTVRRFSEGSNTLLQTGQFRQGTESKAPCTAL